MNGPDYGNINQNVGERFLQAPQDYSILSFTFVATPNTSPDVLGNYGAAYLLMRYAADRAGISFARAYLTADPRTDDRSSFEALAKAAGSPSFAQFFTDFTATL